LEEVPEKLLSVGLGGSDVSFLWGIFLLLPYKLVIHNPVLPGFQGDCKVNGLERDNCKMEAGMPNFSPAFS
jgi:hypothetical protein